jgi:hypothetical protein
MERLVRYIQFTMGRQTSRTETSVVDDAKANGSTNKNSAFFLLRTMSVGPIRYPGEPLANTLFTKTPIE